MNDEWCRPNHILSTNTPSDHATMQPCSHAAMPFILNYNKKKKLAS